MMMMMSSEREIAIRGTSWIKQTRTSPTCMQRYLDQVRLYKDKGVWVFERDRRNQE